MSDISLNGRDSLLGFADISGRFLTDNLSRLDILCRVL
jgi:hypothetical protein